MDLQWIVDSLKEIKTGGFEFILKARDPLVLPVYKRSNLWGRFNYVFIWVFCTIKNQDTPVSLLKENYIYSFFFETPPSPDPPIMGNYKATLHAYIINSLFEWKRVYKSRAFLQGCNPSPSGLQRLKSNSKLLKEYLR